MKGIIDFTEEINAKARFVSKELYVFCNFSTEGYIHLTAEGEFHNKIMLLYNIVHDTSILLQPGHMRRILCLNRSNSLEWKRVENAIDFIQYRKYFDIIHNLRACTAHNTSADNGAIEKAEMIFYDNWKLNTCGKKIPESIEDYEKMVNELNKYDQFLYTWITRLLDYISTNPNKSQIVDSWRAETIQWYATKRDIFYGQLEDMYNVLYHRKNNRNPNGRNGIISALNDWIRNTYCEPGINDLKKWDTLLSTAVSHGIKGSSLTEMKKKIDAKKAETQQAMESTVYIPITAHCHITNKTDLESHNFADYFFQKELENLINQAFINKKAESLLPQDVLQVIIAERFMNVTFDSLVI